MSQKVTDLDDISNPENAYFYVTVGGSDFRVKAGGAWGIATLGGDGTLRSGQRPPTSETLPGFESSLKTLAPNDGTNVSAMIPSGGTTDQVGVYGQKGSGSICARIPDGLLFGGNVRGFYAIDWQIPREAANQVASGSFSCISSGQSNRASSTYSFVGSGYTNWSASAFGVICGGEYNTIQASADYNFIGGGRNNTINTGAVGCLIAGGQNNQVTGTTAYATISGGLGNTASSNYSQVSGGRYNTVSGEDSRAGGAYSSDRGVIGSDVFSSGRFSANGDAQTRRVQLRSDTTDATVEAVTSNNGAASTNNQLLLSDGSAVSLDGKAIVRENATGDCARFTIGALVKRGSGAASTTVVGQTVTQDYADAGAATWVLAVAADTTNGAVKINVTGEADHNLRWLVELSVVEVVG